MTRSDTALAPRALITGMAGFTGRHLAARLASAGYSVWGTTRGDERVPAGTTPIAADLLDASAITPAVEAVQPDVVVHLAAVAHVANGDVARTYLVNIVGTRNLLEALAQLPRTPRAVLLASSANVYGNGMEGVIDETCAPQPANDYAVSKLAMEHAARRWFGELPIVIARPFNYTGVGQSADFLLPKIVAHYARGERIISLGNLDVSRDFSDVRDVVDAYARLVEAVPRSEIFNVCSGTGWTLKAVLDTLAQLAGYEIDVRVDPHFMRPNEVRRLTGSDAKLRAAIGSTPRIPLEDTLRWMLEAARRHPA